MANRREAIKAIASLGVVYMGMNLSCAHAGWPNTVSVHNSIKSEGCSLSGAGSNISSYNLNPSVPSWVLKLLLSAHKDLKEIFQLNPGFSFINEQGSPNAFATSQNLTHDAVDGTILIGKKFLDNEIEKGEESWQAPLLLVLAHEFGHIAQFKFGYHAETPIMELQADAIAGITVAQWLVILKNIPQFNNLYARKLQEQEISHAVDSLFSIGDYNFNDPDHHGTPRQRLQAFFEGYSYLNQSHSRIAIPEVMRKTRRIAENIIG